MKLHYKFIDCSCSYSDNLSNQNKGLNDCVARLVEVSKSEIAKLLFPDPLEMVFE